MSCVTSSPHYVPGYLLLVARCQPTGRMMWCKHCRQDVPGIVVSDEFANDQVPRKQDVVSSGTAPTRFLGNAAPVDDTTGSNDLKTHYLCAGCGEVIATDAQYIPSRESTGHKALGSASDGALGSASDGALGSASDGALGSASDGTIREQYETWEWELDQQLHDVRQLLEARTGNYEQPANRRSALYADVDSALKNQKQSVREQDSKTRRIDTPESKAKIDRQDPSLFAWLVFSFGLMSLTCGAVLVVWSLVTGRHELWRVGLPIALVGQAVILVGIVLLLDRMWRENRAADQRISKVDRQLEELHDTASVFDPSPVSLRRFDASDSNSASPHVIVADIKDQLDRLDHQIGDL
ncbi:MAG: hypothetical protein WBF93_07000 [Pirellulales bacterium]